MAEQEKTVPSTPQALQAEVDRIDRTTGTVLTADNPHDRLYTDEPVTRPIVEKPLETTKNFREPFWAT